MDSQNKKGMEVIIKERKEFLARVEERYSWIPWREPVSMNDTEGNTGLGCRICIAKDGIRGDQIKYLPTSIEGHHKHLKEYHQLEGF